MKKIELLINGLTIASCEIEATSRNTEIISVIEKLILFMQEEKKKGQEL